MHLKKLTLKPATTPRAKRGSKPCDAEVHIIRPRDVQDNLIVRTSTTTLKNKKNSQVAKQKKKNLI